MSSTVLLKEKNETMAFFTKVVSRGLATSTAHFNPVKTVAIIGSGLMGSGIAQVKKKNKTKSIKQLVELNIHLRY